MPHTRAPRHVPALRRRRTARRRSTRSATWPTAAASRPSVRRCATRGRTGPAGRNRAGARRPGLSVCRRGDARAAATNRPGACIARPRSRSPAITTTCRAAAATSARTSTLDGSQASDRFVAYTQSLSARLAADRARQQRRASAHCATSSSGSSRRSNACGRARRPCHRRRCHGASPWRGMRRCIRRAGIAARASTCALTGSCSTPTGPTSC